MKPVARFKFVEMTQQHLVADSVSISQTELIFFVECTDELCSNRCRFGDAAISVFGVGDEEGCFAVDSVAGREGGERKGAFKWSGGFR